MIYDNSNPLEAEQFKLKCNKLYKEKKIVELIDKSQRTIKQNSYAHLILSYFGLQKGYSLEEVKRDILKEIVCPDIFVISSEWDSLLKRNRNALRSTKTLTVDEMSIVIERFKIWALKEADCFLPDAIDKEKVRYMEIEVMKNQKWL
jgi:hypothetical protein